MLYIHNGLFIYFLSINRFFSEKTVDVTGIRTRIVGVEGKHADHLTTTPAPQNLFLPVHEWLSLIYLQDLI